jgi:hypothetical protein
MSRTVANNLTEAAQRYLAKQSRRHLNGILPQRRINGPARKRRKQKLQASRIWQRWELKLLGRYTDAETARKTGRTRSSVFHKRHRLGIAVMPELRPWTAQELSLLGNVPDREIATRTGRAYKTVHQRRRALSIPNAAAVVRRWTPEDDELLGTLPDRELARKLGRTLDSVSIRRHKLGIPPGNPNYRNWTPAEDKLLGQFSDAEVAKRLGRTENSVHHRRIKLRILRPDPTHRRGPKKKILCWALCQTKNWPESLVALFPPLRRGARGSRCPNWGRKRVLWTEKENRLLGKLPDSEIAQLLNCSTKAVSLHRFHLEIPARRQSV